ncbi:MinD/ParA family protein [Thermococcus sp.]|uniref:MinD/ParA family ATP-binding protein n=1 Tax=Thermococcus sp. TaxID=35749 RepID=UPI0026330987|nr:MinD/ParA family protein [Thermococcus sp.]
MIAVVITGRGGAGKTTMAANLATYFSGNGYRALTVDGDLYLPKLAFHFGIYNPRYNVHTLLKNPPMGTMDAVYHDPGTGVDILPGSSSIYDVIDIDQKRLRNIVREVQTRYNLTIIDSPVGIPFDTVSTFHLAQYQLIVVEIERGPIHSVHRMIENEVVKLKAIGDSYDLHVGVIINKVHEAAESIDDIVDFLEYSIEVPVIGVIPFDPRVPEATNYGTPVLHYAPFARASRALSKSGGLLDRWMFGGKNRESLWERLKGAINSLVHRGGTPSLKKF